MNRLREKWRSDEGSIDFMQLIVGLLIIAIAAVGTFQALYYGYEQLDYQMRYRKAISLARSYVEYWQGRIHTDFDPKDQATRVGNLVNPLWVTLDERTNSGYDDILCQLSYGPLEPVDMPATGQGIDHWKVRVYVKWWELGEPSTIPPHEIFFDATMVPATL